ncbi:DUF2269 domain-containing protein [Nocardia sp. NPDC057353]|uniref:DUF2269 domain-containing protein n=1 Tax=Nocardia sp. NPDC057353 TaxID=3346104 RepID=UPI00363A71B8
MTFARRTRQLALLAHIVSSVGWMGAVAVYVGLAVAVLAARDPLAVRGALTSMRISVYGVIVPLAFAALATGVILSTGTIWGLLRHYWVVFKLAFTVLGIGVLILYTDSIDYWARQALSAQSADSIVELRSPTHLVHSAGGLVILLVAAVLSVYRPRGMTRYGRSRTPGATSSSSARRRRGGEGHSPCSA